MHKKYLTIKKVEKRLVMLRKAHGRANPIGAYRRNEQELDTIESKIAVWEAILLGIRSNIT